MSSPSLQLFPTSTHWHWDLWVPRTIIRLVLVSNLSKLLHIDIWNCGSPELLDSLQASSSLQLIRTSTHWHSELWVPRTSTLFPLEHVTRCPPYSNAKGNIVWRNTQPQGMKRVSMTKQIQAPKSINDQQLISLLCLWDVQKCPKSKSQKESQQRELQNLFWAKTLAKN